MLIAQQIYQATEKHPEYFRDPVFWGTIIAIYIPSILVTVGGMRWITEEQRKNLREKVSTLETNYNIEKSRREEIENRYETLQERCKSLKNEFNGPHH